MSSIKTDFWTWKHAERSVGCREAYALVGCGLVVRGYLRRCHVPAGSKRCVSGLPGHCGGVVGRAWRLDPRRLLRTDDQQH